MVVASIITGVLVHRIGYYTPLMIIGVCFMSVGAGLLTTLQIDTPTANLIGYQILYGCGLGLSSQAPFLAAQAVLPKADIPIGAALMFFSQLLSGAVFVSVGQNIFENQLLHRLSSVPDFRPEMIQDSGAASLANVPSSLKATVLVAYNESLRQLFQVALIIVCVSLLGALTMEWRSVKKNVVKQEKSNEDDDRKHVEEKSKDAHDGIVKGERSQTDDNECAVTG